MNGGEIINCGFDEGFSFFSNDRFYCLGGNANIYCQFCDTPSPEPPNWIALKPPKWIALTVQHTIALEIKEEIVKHFISSEKEQDARKARTLCSRIMSLPNYAEVSLANIKPVEPNEKLLGPDSNTDKKLLGEALRRLNENANNIVFIATHDGGIRCEAAFLRTKKGMNIFTPSSLDEDYRNTIKKSIIAVSASADTINAVKEEIAAARRIADAKCAEEKSKRKKSWWQM
jgi:hypothetical protein